MCICERSRREAALPMTAQQRLSHVLGEEISIGKHFEKVSAQLAVRVANAPVGPGFKKPGSMNPRKTGFSRRTARIRKRSK